MSKTRYEVLGTLGCGATSRVDKARDTVLGRTVALKTLVHSFGAPTEQKQFLREAQIVSQLSHPSIINLYDVGIEDESIAYLVMEYVAGKTLQQVLSGSTIPFPRACAWAADLAGALSRAHKAGIIHGDVKPANILVTEEGNVKLGDFGIARFATQVSGSGRLMGTPAYLSSLGIVLYQMVTGAAPFDGTSVSAVCAQILSADPMPPSQRNPALPKEIDHVILRCLAKNSADRYPSAEAFAASLYPFARQAPLPEAKAEPAKKVKGPWLSRPMQPGDLWVVAALAVIAVAGVPASRAMAARFAMPAAPVVSKVTPPPPRDLLGYSQTTTVADVDENEESVETAKAAQKQRAARSAAIARSVALHGNVPATKMVSATTAVPAPVLAPPPMPIPATRGTEHATLRIEIDSTVAEGALAIFADQTLLFTTELHTSTASEPMRLEHNLPVGPHQLRVALYRPDKSLQVSKEGLGEIRIEGQNALHIHVTKRAKLLVKHETSLDVIWPSAATPGGTPAGGAATKLAASTK
jgi:hypothetical protein